MFVSDRQKKILNLINKKKQIKTKELCKLFDVSEPTIRADLQYLASLDKLIQVWGGALVTEDKTLDYPRVIRTATMSKEKKKIAKAMVKDIPPNSTIFLDSSTTILSIAQELASSDIQLTIITTSIDIAYVLCSHPSISIILCGGSVHKSERACYGESVLKSISQYHADLVIVSCHGLSKSRGVLNGDLELTKIKQVLIKNSSAVWLCADHSKFGRNGLVSFMDFNQVDRLYADKIPESWSTFFQNTNIEVISNL